MKKKTVLITILISVMLISFSFTWEYINKSSKDFSNQKPEMILTFNEIMQKMETDSSGLKNKLVALEGEVSKIAKEGNAITLELGNKSTLSSVICQIDERHLAGFESLKEGNTVKIKGIISALIIDRESLFGNTVQMTYCSLYKN